MSSEAVEWRSACRWFGAVTLLYALANFFLLATSVYGRFGIHSAVVAELFGFSALASLFVALTPIALFVGCAQHRRANVNIVVALFGGFQALIGLILGVWGFLSFGPYMPAFLPSFLLAATSSTTLTPNVYSSYASVMIGPVFMYLFVVGFQLSLLLPLVFFARALGDRDIDHSAPAPLKTYAAATVNMFIGFVGFVHTIQIGILLGRGFEWVGGLASFGAVYTIFWLAPGVLTLAGAGSNKAGTMRAAAVVGIVLFVLKVLSAIGLIIYIFVAFSSDPFFLDGFVETLPFTTPILIAVCLSMASMVVAIVVAHKAANRMRNGAGPGGYVIVPNQSEDVEAFQTPTYDADAFESKV